MINLTIDNIKIKSQEGQMVLSAAHSAGISIPTLCHNENFPAHGSCGICIVEDSDGRLIRACATPVADGMVINTNSERVIAARKRLLELQLSMHTGDCKAPCQLACPAQTDCQSYIALLAQGQIKEAVSCMLEAHPFPASMARVCPRPCEAKCRRGIRDEPINIAGLKRFAAEMIAKEIISSSKTALDICMPEIKPDTGQAVAIVGGGPAGLTAAYFLRRAGHEVAVFDYMPKMGGLLRYGIPEYRLPKAVLDAEISLLAHMGIGLHNGVSLVSRAMLMQSKHVHNPKSVTEQLLLTDLQKQYDAVIIAIGAGASRPMGIPGEDLPCVFGGIDFLREVACDSQGMQSVIIGQKVVVIGGSNTAIDAARTALRLGAGSVTVAYRRTKDEMLADPAEITEAEEEGVKFKFLVSPMEVTASGIRLQLMTLGEPDADGRLNPKPIPGQEQWLNSDIIITAIGQAVDLSILETLEKSQSAINTNPDTFQTSLPGVFAIGDVTGQSAYAIEAIGYGRKAAAAIHEYLSAEDQLTPSWETLPAILVKDEKSSPDLTHIPSISRENPAKKEAYKGFEEVHQNLTATQAVSEASRCLSCGCRNYSGCKLISLANQYYADPKKHISRNQPKHPIDTSNPLFTYDPNKCVLCGQCIHACAQDRAVLTMAHRGLKAQVVAHPQSNCAHCGNCAAVCPVGARA